MRPTCVLTVLSDESFDKTPGDGGRGFESLEVTANPHAMPFYEHLEFVADQIVDTEGYPAPRMSRPTNSRD